MHAPNGLIVNMFGPVEGRRHDAFMLGVSGLPEKLRRLQLPNGDPYVVYGDPAYGVTDNILAPFRGAFLTVEEQEFNKCMSKVRVSVEWAFGKLLSILLSWTSRKIRKFYFSLSPSTILLELFW